MTLREWLQQTNTTSASLARRLGVTETRVSRWLSKHVKIPLTIANKLHVLTKGEVTALDLETGWMDWSPHPEDPARGWWTSRRLAAKAGGWLGRGSGKKQGVSE